ncbi:MAG: 2-dehydro-3-deoxy-6-phosphogalactonate aldolase [Hyphomicrobiaceae bacterium]
MISWTAAFAETPLIAILRGLQPARAAAVAGSLYDAGFRIVEVPLNSPRPLDSIEAISKAVGSKMIVGAGTVLAAADVDGVVAAGGRLIVAPNFDASVGAHAMKRGATWCPGVVTPTEAFAALRHGATALKIFPAEQVPPRAISALRAVLPSGATLVVVGGITPETMADYYAAGAQGFGLGSALFRPEYGHDEIAKRATAFVSAFEALRPD